MKRFAICLGVLIFFAYPMLVEGEGFNDEYWSVNTFTSDPIPQGVTPSEIECEIHPDKENYFYGETIELKYVCSNINADSFEIPRMMKYPIDFGEGIVLQDERGNKFKFLKLTPISVALFQGDLKFKNGATIATFTVYPPPSCSFIELSRWIDTWTDTRFTIGERQDLYNNAKKQIPVGKYKVWLDLDYTWRDGPALTTLLGSSEDSQKVSWWHLKGGPRRASFEVMEKEQRKN